jgi:HrpA-like RNA helicase
MIPEEASGPRPATDDDSNQLRKIYEKLLQKKKASEARAEERDDAQSEVSNRAQPKKERKRERSRSRSRENGMSKLPVFKPEFKLRLYEMLDLNLLESIKSEAALRLPVYKQHGRILHTILNNQVTLITGETGCGKSTQIPRILW